MIQRDNSIDATKAFAILLVVIGHVIQYSKYDFDNDHLFKFIYSFHMPLFIFISGYVTYKSNFILKNFLKNKFTTLLIPYFSWLFLSAIVSSIKNNDNVLLNIRKYIIYPDYGLWFLWVLFFMHLILYVQIALFKKHFNLSIIISCFFLLIISYFIKIDNIFSFKMYSFLLPFFYLGFYFRKYNYEKISIFKFWYLLIPFFASLAFFWRRNDLITIGDIFIKSKMIIYFYKYITAIFAIFIVIGLFKSIKKFPSFVLKIGTNSLIIYSMNFYFLTIFLYFNFDNFITRYLHFLCFPIALFIISLSIITGKFLKKSKILSFLLLGTKLY